MLRGNIGDSSHWCDSDSSRSCCSHNAEYWPRYNHSSTSSGEQKQEISAVLEGVSGAAPDTQQEYSTNSRLWQGGSLEFRAPEIVNVQYWLCKRLRLIDFYRLKTSRAQVIVQKNGVGVGGRPWSRWTARRARRAEWPHHAPIYCRLQLKLSFRYSLGQCGNFHFQVEMIQFSGIQYWMYFFISNRVLHRLLH